MKGKTLTIRLSERRRNKLYLYAAQKDIAGGRGQGAGGRGKP